MAPPSKPRSKRFTEHFTVPLSPDTLKALDTVARDRETTKAALVRKLIVEFLGDRVKDKAA